AGERGAQLLSEDDDRTQGIVELPARDLLACDLEAPAQRQDLGLEILARGGALGHLLEQPERLERFGGFARMQRRNLEGKAEAIPRIERFAVELPLHGD